MKPLAVEAKKSFSHGFVLTEAEFRRIVDLLETQLDKLGVDTPPPWLFTLKFKNGVIAKTPDIDEVTDQENSGSGRIVRLAIRYGGAVDSPSAEVEFIDADEDEEPGYTSVRYTLRASDRDWVFVTSSLLSERIDKVKRFTLNQLGFRGRSRIAYRLISPFAALLVMLVFFVGMVGSIAKVAKREAVSPLSEELSERLDEGSLTNPIEALIIIQERQEERTKNLDPAEMFSSIFWMVGGLVLFLLLIVLVALFFTRYYPVYCFVWGDYEQYFNSRESARRFWLVVIGAGIVVSVIGGLIANHLAK